MEEEKTMEAAALRFDPTRDAAPVILALGQGEMAKRIVKQAREDDIPVVEDAPTAGMLNRFAVGDVIPPEMYEVVAKILVFISQADAEYAQAVSIANTDRNQDEKEGGRL